MLYGSLMSIPLISQWLTLDLVPTKKTAGREHHKEYGVVLPTTFFSETRYSVQASYFLSFASSTCLFLPHVTHTDKESSCHGLEIPRSSGVHLDIELRV